MVLSHYNQSKFMLDIVIIAVGRLKEDFWQAAAAEYLKRLKPYARCRIEEIKAEALDNTFVKAKRLEAERLQAAIAKHSAASVYLLAEQGTLYDSVQFSQVLSQTNREIVLVIAGTAGFSQEIFKNYPKLSLSALTFPHELARVILLEQLYRATTIINKKDYHY
jgi:23S rRNA (pseudouridine1915-N3)-methyltransferase